jgi:predicted nucleotidyltransferase
MSEQPWGLKAEEIECIRRVLAAHPGIEKAIVYGSRALGTQRPGSDIDITVIGEMAWSELHQIETDLDNLDLPYTIDLSLASQIENQALRQHISEHGEQLYPATRNP